MIWWQKQHPSNVMRQVQLAPQSVWNSHAPQPPASTQTGEPCWAPAADAETIDPAPNAAAPMPARFSRRRLETRSSVIAIRRTPNSLADHGISARDPRAVDTANA
ncbi:MAG TPA: hypothetical protein VFR32_00965 [Gaiellaceae bacterium]|nr:hypothetical protein [Gaiellaceae bacterium]